ncbi:uncharacterized protein LOC136072738 isoform X2 [Hydra vulgaris]|uniref:uncharacterized protein LOC136072738 isoform X2 n=1 Tax=Hydra vulgaris TaxID=6087 RepID=UPI0032EA4F68
MLVSRIQAEVTLNAYISKRNTEVLQDESSDSECSLVNVKDFTETCIVLSESEESAVKRLLDELVIKVSSYQENNFCGKLPFEACENIKMAHDQGLIIDEKEKKSKIKTVDEVLQKRKKITSKKDLSFKECNENNFESMITVFMKSGKVLEAEKMFKKWVSSKKQVKLKKQEVYPREKVKCPICYKCVVDFPRHLRSSKHKVSKEDARIARGVYGLRKSAVASSEAKKTVKYVCPMCKAVVKRIHDHLYKSPHYLKNEPEKYREMLQKKTIFEKVNHITVPLKHQQNYNFQQSFDSNVSLDQFNIQNPESPSISNRTKSIDDEPTFKDYLEIFCLYLKSRSGGNKDLKSASNEMGQVRRIMEVLPSDDPCYDKFFDLERLQTLWFPHAQRMMYEPGTKRSYLLSLSHFIDFLIRSKLTPNVPYVVPVTKVEADVMLVCQNEISKWRQSLRAEEEERQFDVLIQDGEKMIPKEYFKAILDSNFNVTVIKKIKEIHCQYSLKPNEFILTRSLYTNTRDCIFFKMVCDNISRSGAIANLTLEEYLKGTFTPTGLYVVLVRKHKTFKKYGPCQIVINSELKFLCDCFYKIKRNGVPGHKSENMFVTWSGCSLESGGVSTQLSSYFSKCLPDSVSLGNVSATLIRKSLLTFFYDNYPDMKKDLATLMKHKQSTGEKWYYLNQTKKEVSGTSEKISNVIFGSQPDIYTIENAMPNNSLIGSPISNVTDNDLFSENEEDDNESDWDGVTGSLMTSKKISWTTLEVDELKKIFKIDSTSSFSQSNIRMMISGNDILKNRNAKQVYDKLSHLQKNALKGDLQELNKKECMTKKVVFPTKYTNLIRVIFSKEIAGKLLTTEKDVYNKINQTEKAKEMLNEFSIKQILTKIRYEKAKLRMKKK